MFSEEFMVCHILVILVSIILVINIMTKCDKRKKRVKFFNKKIEVLKEKYTRFKNNHKKLFEDVYELKDSNHLGESLIWLTYLYLMLIGVALLFVYLITYMKNIKA